jgi:hypothetical protein
MSHGINPKNVKYWSFKNKLSMLMHQCQNLATYFCNYFPKTVYKQVLMLQLKEGGKTLLPPGTGKRHKNAVDYEKREF